MEDRDPRHTARLDARCRERQRDLVERAARRRGVYLSEFIREAALEEARRELEETEDGGGR